MVALDNEKIVTEMMVRPTGAEEKQQGNSVQYDMAAEAVALVKLGRVFPVWNIRDGVCSCPKGPACTSAGKHPMGNLVPQGLAQATRNGDNIRYWWSRAPNANIGLVPEDYFVLDVDPKHGGMQSLEKLVSEHGPLPSTLTAVTGSGGLHVFFLNPPEKKVRNTTNVLGDAYPGLDTRAGERGYVVAAPSLHKSGNRYRWFMGEGPDAIAVAAAPDWLVERVIEKPKPKVEPTKPLHEITDAERRRARGLLDWAAHEVACAAEGTRNGTLFKMTAFIGHLVGAGYIERDEAEVAFENAGSQCGLGDREVAQTMANGLDYSIAEPRGLPDDGERKREWMIERGLIVMPLDIEILRARRAQEDA